MAMSTVKCDICDEYMDLDRYEARTPRPSDPTDMCCVLWLCDEHGVEMGAKRASEWSAWIESDEARSQGYMWLS